MVSFHWKGKKKAGRVDLDKEESSNKEEFVEKTGLFPLVETDPSPAEIDIDIVAVHGLGGNWHNTWTHPDTKTNWFRDFLPGQLREAGIRPRIMSYGYDSTTAFSRSIGSIGGVAEDLLDRLKLSRPDEINKSRPILLIAHSLGGLIVKKAMNTAWFKIGERFNPYGDLLENVRGLMFFGVPHRGSDIAFWLGLPATLLDKGLAGFGGNTRFLDALKTNSVEWREISEQFVQRADRVLLIRSYFETKRLGNVLIVDRDSAQLNLPNEICSGIPESNHRNICRFESAGSQRYSPIWQTIYEISKQAITATVRKTSVIMVSPDAPIRTPKFYGREAELKKMLMSLGGPPGRKTIVLWGLGSFGKSQLALKFQSLHHDKKASQIWINVKALETFAAFKDITIDVLEYEHAPAIAPTDTSWSFIQPSKLPLYQVKAQLEEESDRNWLMVIDGLDDLPARYRIEQLLPQCNHGTIILTTTRSDLASILKAHGIEVCEIDEAAGVELFLERFQLLRKLVHSLDGSPLAIEQASADLSMQGPLSSRALQQYLSRLEDEYVWLMAIKPDQFECFYDKERSIISTFNLLKTAIQEYNINAIDVLTMCSFFGKNEIPIAMLATKDTHEDDLTIDLSEGVGRITGSEQFSEIFPRVAQLSEESLDRAVMSLKRFSCIKVRSTNDSIYSFSIQNAIRRWCQGMLSLANKAEWAVLAAYKISANLYCQEVSMPQRGYLPVLRSLDNFLFSGTQFIQLQAPDGVFCWKAWLISLRFARFYRLNKAFKDARISIERAINYERIIHAETWLKTLPSLKRFQAMATYTQEDGDHIKAAEAFVSLLSACKGVVGSDDTFTLEVAEQSGSLHRRMARDRQLLAQTSQGGCREKQGRLEGQDPRLLSSLPLDNDEEPETDEQYRLREEVEGFREEFGDTDGETQILMNRLAAVYVRDHRWTKAKPLFWSLWKQYYHLAQQDSKLRTRALDCLFSYVTTSEAAGSPLNSLQEVFITGTHAQARDDAVGDIRLWAAQCGYESLFRIFLEERADLEFEDDHGVTALIVAATTGQEAVVQRLLEKGADIMAKGRYGWTAIHAAVKGGNNTVVQLLLEEGADIMAKDEDGLTALHWAAFRGHTAMVQLLLEKEADIMAKTNSRETPLHKAAERGHTAVVQLLLEKGADIMAKDRYGWTALHWAAFRGHTAILQLLLEKEADIMAKTNSRETLFHNAAEGGHTAVVQLLLEKGADIMAKGRYGWTALHWAAFRGHTVMVQLLLEKGADIMAKGRYGWTALHWAAFRGHTAIVQLLLEKEADIMAKTNSRETPLHKAAERGHTAVVQLLLEKGADIMAKGRYGLTALHWAAIRGHTAIVQLLLEKEADIMAKTNYRETLFHNAAEGGHTAVVQLLLEKGADIMAKDRYGWTALHWAAFRGHTAIVQLLLEKEADIMAKTNSRETLFHNAAEGGHTAVVQLLLEKGADIMAKDEDGLTALHWAAFRGHTAMVQLLLEKEADIMAKTNSRETPLHKAAERGHTAVVQLLLEKGADIMAKDRYGWTALHWAAFRGHTAMVQLLLEKEADIMAKTNSRETPLHKAAERGHTAVVQLLLEKGADIMAKGRYGWTAIHAAAKGRNNTVVQLLLEEGADIIAKDEDGWTALHWAAFRGHTAVVQLLLEKRADIMAEIEDRETVINAALEGGNDMVVQLLHERYHGKEERWRDMDHHVMHGSLDANPPTRNS